MLALKAASVRVGRSVRWGHHAFRALRVARRSVADLNHKQALMRSAILNFGSAQGLPWWWEEVQDDSALCSIDFESLPFRNKKSSKQVAVWELPLFLMRALPRCLALRGKYDYVFTFECSLSTFALAFWQTVLFIRRPRHVVLQFIMREKTRRLSSKLKYAWMRICFSSIHMVICSSRSEAAYYSRVFGWPRRKSVFVPFHTSRRHVLVESRPQDRYVFAAGRSFRDFPTFYEAAEKAGLETVVVASANTPRPAAGSRIRFYHDIPFQEYLELMKRCTVVALPLLNTEISAGQIVMLHAMAMRKPVVATRTASTIDYIVDGDNGLLVPPNDVPALQNALESLMTRPDLCDRLGAAAQRSVTERHLPHHYSAGVRAVLQLSDGRSE